MNEHVARPSPMHSSRRAFTPRDQQWFASLSGDHNPLHMDDIAARRLLFGQPVVHGVHTTLWALDRYFHRERRHLERLSVTFHQPIFIDEEVTLTTVRRADGQPGLRVEVDSSTVIGIALRLAEPQAAHPGKPTPESDDLQERAHPLRDRARQLDVGELADLRGHIPIKDDRYAASAFPSLAAATSPRAVAELAALSYLVGMECPGERSIFGALTVSFASNVDAVAVDWEVTRVQESLSSLRMRVQGAGLEGTVTALVRPAPVQQPTTKHLQAHVVDGEFDGTRALVIGGSRGIGELAAKLLAAGGADVAVTWHRGERDATETVGDILAAGRSARALPFDAFAPTEAFERLSRTGWLPTHILYFASPRITTRRLRPFDAALSRDLIRYYVEGFANLVEAYRRYADRPVVLLYPSTAAIDWGAKGLIEYASAKAAGEHVARTLDESEDWLSVVVARFPALPTDQTVRLSPADDEVDPIPVVLRALRDCHDA